MKKSGFTLIELLAVIVILAIIALIAVPIILNVIEKAREGSAIDSGYNYLDAVENAMALNMLDTSKPDIKDGVYSVSQLNTTYGVQVKGNAPKEGSVTIENGKVKECTLQIDNYELTCNGNELILGKSTQAVIPEHRMMDSYVEPTDDMRIYFSSFIGEGGFDTTGKYTNEEISEKFGNLTSTQEFQDQLLYFLPSELGSNMYSIEKVITVNTGTVPSNAVASKDISANQDGSVMVWFLDNDNNNIMELYIGQDGGVIAPINCTALFMGVNIYAHTANYINSTNIDLTYDLTNFKTDYAKNMLGMFFMGVDIKSIDMRNCNTQNVIDMSAMFANLSNLTSINISGFDTTNVKYMRSMFNGCKNLSNIDISNFNTLNVTDMSAMFADCTSLTSLDLSSFDTRNVTNMKWMFATDSALTTIYKGPNWVINPGTNTDYMFYDCGTDTLTLKQ